MSRSRWEQIEAIEALERGEGTKGREIIRVVPGADGDDDSGGRGVESAGAGPHKILMQDARGTRVYAIELERVVGLGLNMSIGCKIVLRDVCVARGVVLLQLASVCVLGGKIEGLHKAWREGRKVALRAAIEGPGEG